MKTRKNASVHKERVHAEVKFIIGEMKMSYRAIGTLLKSRFPEKYRDASQAFYVVGNCVRGVARLDVLQMLLEDLENVKNG